jgi:hypothetical protein
LRLNLFTSNFCVARLLAVSLSLNFYNHQIIIGIKERPPETLDIKYTRIPSPIYQDVVWLCLSFRRCASEFMNIMMWEHCTPEIWFLDMAKFATLTPLSLLISRKLLFPSIGLKVYSLPTARLISSNRILNYMELLDYTF